MLKIGFVKSLFKFNQNKYICATAINISCTRRQISTTQKYFKEEVLGGDVKFPKEPTSAGSMRDVRNEIIKRIGIDAGYTQVPKPRDHLKKYEPKYEDLPARTMQDSYTSAIIPLSTSTKLQNKYVTVLGHVRLGRLMEDMDLFAVWVCHKHVHVPNLDPSIHLPYTFVTILVDKIDFTDLITQFDKDIRISGHISWVGRSSMEIIVWLEQMDANGKWQKITRALFLMAARNATNTSAAPVNPITPCNDNEKKIFDGGVERKNLRTKLSNLSLFKVEPNDIESKLIHDIYMRTLPKDSMALNRRILPKSCKWMKDTIVSNVTTSFPENRNAHNRVFGGYLMKMALEISWMCAYQYCGKRPKVKHISDISFQKPVAVASFIKMTAQVIYTEMNYMQIMTVADILSFDGNAESHTSNVFYFTLITIDKVPEVLPRTYHEAMWYLEGRRKLTLALNLNEDC